MDYAIGKQPRVSGVELPVAPQLPPWGNAESRIPLPSPILGDGRLHLITWNLEQPGQSGTALRNSVPTGDAHPV